MQRAADGAAAALMEITDMFPTVARYASVLAVFRIFVGMWWFLHGISKLTNPQFAVPNGAFVGMVQGISSSTSGAFHDFVTGVVIPHASTFATLVAWGETLTGISLTLGLLTRLGGAGGVFLALTYWLVKQSYTTLYGYATLDTAALALSAVHLALPTGLVAGIDGWIASRKRPGAIVEKSSS